ncbi:hypothetical protein QVZ41_06225 [Wenyingzhuangia sp. chi5]|uniref:Fibronectin type-III domain-containing protein n=1 Tax=Wenyingzhuangia gilva TaxID=3057677 RepID=A0ABT8VR53_9FLAO|nr:hypothetical protein [Wenyingzhuangia sp. chi5]MDO3694441.1 hypothetical protein [Wenyingzhuangia sp. chi5]
MNIINQIKIFTFFSFFLLACTSSEKQEEVVKNEEPKIEVELATLQTEEAEEIDVYTATIWGQVTKNGGASVTEKGVCYGLSPNPVYEGAKTGPTSTKGSGEFKVELTGLNAASVYYARAYALNAKGVSYGNEVSFTTLPAASPLVSINETTISGAHDIFINVELEQGDLTILELGIVYAKQTKPTVDDTKIANGDVKDKYLQRITGLDEQTTYFVRPYVITSESTLYGEEKNIQTIKKGSFTYSFRPNDADTATRNRLIKAFDEATNYYNNFTSIVKHVTVNYSPGTPTADANFAGWINMGSKVDYQKTGTAMHEMAHTVGVGTHWRYAELMGPPWNGSRANKVLQMMTNNPNAVLRGDGTHMWPYGINGAHEDTGSDELYMVHALIIQAMKVDGLPSN